MRLDSQIYRQRDGTRGNRVKGDKEKNGGRRRWKEETEKWVDIKRTKGTGERTRNILGKSKRKVRKSFWVWKLKGRSEKEVERKGGGNYWKIGEKKRFLCEHLHEIFIVGF